MPLDAVCLTGVVRELREALLDLRIEKVQQPARDQVILTLRGNRRLLLCAGASQARVHLTALGRENPAQPPMFCMLLRKHLTGGRLTAIDQPPAERVVILTVSMVDELGEPGRRRLVAECMGRRSNLILLDGEDRIIDCLRRVDLEMSPQRQVLPGLFYRLPPAQEKEDPLTAGGGRRVAAGPLHRPLSPGLPGAGLGGVPGRGAAAGRRGPGAAGGGLLRVAGYGPGGERAGLHPLDAHQGGRARRFLLHAHPPVRFRHGGDPLGQLLPDAGRLL